MTNSQFNIAFLNWVQPATKQAILTNIANHYGISADNAYNEVVDEDAENILDYVTGSLRNATNYMVKKFKFSN
ncbi:hypothetical protein [Pedobacter sp.]